MQFPFHERKRMEVQIDGKPQESFQTDKDLATGEKTVYAKFK